MVPKQRRIMTGPAKNPSVWRTNIDECGFSALHGRGMKLPHLSSRGSNGSKEKLAFHTCGSECVGPDNNSFESAPRAHFVDIPLALVIPLLVTYTHDKVCTNVHASNQGCTQATRRERSPSTCCFLAGGSLRPSSQKGLWANAMTNRSQSPKRGFARSLLSTQKPLSKVPYTRSVSGISLCGPYV